MLRLCSGAPYVGITREGRFSNRMKEHQRAAQRELPKFPGEVYVLRHGWGSVEELAVVLIAEGSSNSPADRRHASARRTATRSSACAASRAARG
jgi:hypothetical protein